MPGETVTALGQTESAESPLNEKSPSRDERPPMIHRNIVAFDRNTFRGALECSRRHDSPPSPNLVYPKPTADRNDTFCAS